MILQFLLLLLLLLLVFLCGGPTAGLFYVVLFHLGLEQYNIVVVVVVRGGFVDGFVMQYGIFVGGSIDDGGWRRNVSEI